MTKLNELRRRMLRVLRETGQRKRTVLDGLAGGDRAVLDSLIRDRLVRVKPGTSKRGTEYEAAP
jgi:hypothetical protein